MRNIYLTISAILFLLFSCKKDALNGEYEPFRGKWEYIYTIEETSVFDQWTGQTFTSYDTLWAQELSKLYSIIFETNGILKQLESETIMKKSRIVFDTFKESSNCSSLMQTGSLFEIHLNNNSEDSFIGCLGTDTLLTLNNLHLPESVISESNGSSSVSCFHFFVKQ